MPDQTEKPLTGPADTADPSVQVSSVTPRKAEEAKAGKPTADATVKVPQREAPARDDSNDRIETYATTGPSGEPLTVEHNLETGETTVSPGSANRG